MLDDAAHADVVEFSLNLSHLEHESNEAEKALLHLKFTLQAELHSAVTDADLNVEEAHSNSNGNDNGVLTDSDLSPEMEWFDYEEMFSAPQPPADRFSDLLTFLSQRLTSPCLLDEYVSKHAERVGRTLAPLQFPDDEFMLSPHSEAALDSSVLASLSPSTSCSSAALENGSPLTTTASAVSVLDVDQSPAVVRNLDLEKQERDRSGEGQKKFQKEDGDEARDDAHEDRVVIDSLQSTAAAAAASSTNVSKHPRRRSLRRCTPRSTNSRSTSSPSTSGRSPHTPVSVPTTTTPASASSSEGELNRPRCSLRKSPRAIASSRTPRTSAAPTKFSTLGINNHNNSSSASAATPTSIDPNHTSPRSAQDAPQTEHQATSGTSTPSIVPTNRRSTRRSLQRPAALRSPPLFPTQAPSSSSSVSTGSTESDLGEETPHNNDDASQAPSPFPMLDTQALSDSLLRLRRSPRTPLLSRGQAPPVDLIEGVLHPPAAAAASSTTTSSPSNTVPGSASATSSTAPASATSSSPRSRATPVKTALVAVHSSASTVGSSASSSGASSSSLPTDAIEPPSSSSLVSSSVGALLSCASPNARAFVSDSSLSMPPELEQQDDADNATRYDSNRGPDSGSPVSEPSLVLRLSLSPSPVSSLPESQVPAPRYCSADDDHSLRSLTADLSHSNRLSSAVSVDSQGVRSPEHLASLSKPSRLTLKLDEVGGDKEANEDDSDKLTEEEEEEEDNSDELADDADSDELTEEEEDYSSLLNIHENATTNRAETDTVDVDPPQVEEALESSAIVHTVISCSSSSSSSCAPSLPERRTDTLIQAGTHDDDDVAIVNIDEDAATQAPPKHEPEAEVESTTGGESEREEFKRAQPDRDLQEQTSLSTSTPSTSTEAESHSQDALPTASVCVPEPHPNQSHHVRASSDQVRTRQRSRSSRHHSGATSSLHSKKVSGTHTPLRVQSRPRRKCTPAAAAASSCEHRADHEQAPTEPRSNLTSKQQQQVEEIEDQAFISPLPVKRTRYVRPLLGHTVPRQHQPSGTAVGRAHWNGSASLLSARRKQPHVPGNSRSAFIQVEEAEREQQHERQRQQEEVALEPRPTLLSPPPLIANGGTRSGFSPVHEQISRPFASLSEPREDPNVESARLASTPRALRRSSSSTSAMHFAQRTDLASKRAAAAAQSAALLTTEATLRSVGRKRSSLKRASSFPSIRPASPRPVVRTPTARVVIRSLYDHTPPSATKVLTCSQEDSPRLVSAVRVVILSPPAEHSSPHDSVSAKKTFSSSLFSLSALSSSSSTSSSSSSSTSSSSCTSSYSSSCTSSSSSSSSSHKQVLPLATNEEDEALNLPTQCTPPNRVVPRRLHTSLPSSMSSSEEEDEEKQDENKELEDDSLSSVFTSPTSRKRSRSSAPVSSSLGSSSASSRSSSSSSSCSRSATVSTLPTCRVVISTRDTDREAKRLRASPLTLAELLPREAAAHCRRTDGATPAPSAPSREAKLRQLRATQARRRRRFPFHPIAAVVPRSSPTLPDSFLVAVNLSSSALNESGLDRELHSQRSGGSSQDPDRAQAAGPRKKRRKLRRVGPRPQRRLLDESF